MHNEECPWIEIVFIHMILFDPDFFQLLFASRMMNLEKRSFL